MALSPDGLIIIPVKERDDDMTRIAQGFKKTHGNLVEGAVFTATCACWAVVATLTAVAVCIGYTVCFVIDAVRPA